MTPQTALTRPLRILALSPLFLALACGSEPAPGSADSGADRGADVGPDRGCDGNSDCPPGWWCVGPPGCDAVWTCQADNPCSAAAPFDACTCRGAYGSVSAGCPNERYAYEDPFLPDYLMGTPCSGTVPVERGDVSLRGALFDEFEGDLVHLVLQDRTHDALVNYGATRVRDGEFEATWYDVYDPSEAAYDIRFWVDLDGAQDCGPDDLAWTVAVTPTPADPGAVVMAVEYDALEPTPCP